MRRDDSLAVLDGDVLEWDRGRDTKETTTDAVLSESTAAKGSLGSWRRELIEGESGIG